jgi:hypothetical protein
MAKRRDLIVEDASIPLPPPRLVIGEDAATYDQLAARIAATVAPQNALEQVWVRDVVDLTWEVVRLRRLKAHLFTIGAVDGLAAIMRGLGEQYDTKAHGWAARQPAAVTAVNTQLSAAGLDVDAITTSTFAVRIDQFERIERMLAMAEARRAAALHEIAGWRAEMAAQLRAAALAAEEAPPIADAEFALVAPGETEGAAPA